MKIYNADLHIHSPHSIAVSKSLNLETMLSTCKMKGLDILGTGDILQPEWQAYMEKNLEKREGVFSYKDIYFILQSEIEDIESIHHIVFFPDFQSVKEVQKKLSAYSKNILNEWGGRPRVNLSPPELVEVLDDNGALIGPAHAFTPFKAIFRQNKFKTLEECYQSAIKNIFFLELGLSANTQLADKMDGLKQITFLSNSDAHSEAPRSLGREFNRFLIETPSFEEISLALQRRNDRKITLNVGLHPKLGKYYKMFCSKCRRRVIFKKTDNSVDSIFNRYEITDDFIIYYSNNTQDSRKDYINQVSKNRVSCPACRDKTGNSYKIKLGVSERIDIISSQEKPLHPAHRPPYINAIPLVDIFRAVKGIKSTNSKTVLNSYQKIIESLGTEFHILLDLDINVIKDFNKDIASVIEALRNDEIKYTPGGGGTYGSINFDL